MPSVPNATTALTRDEINTSSSQVVFTWVAPSSTGGAPILDYTIQWDQGTSNYIQTATGITALTFTKTGVSAGTTYKFKV
jgi:hypothetical protein